MGNKLYYKKQGTTMSIYLAQHQQRSEFVTTEVHYGHKSFKGRFSTIDSIIYLPSVVMLSIVKC